MILENIHSPADVKVLPMDKLITLASEMRAALIQKLSKRGGHVGPNLGIVETTIALHYVFHSPVDKIVYDVSHQCYCHKMLTGRNEAFLKEEKYGDVSGFTNPAESEHDFFTIGHTSTSVSLACGLAKARDLKGANENIIAVIGDGSLSGGEALEGLNNAQQLGTNFIIVVNDNDMSIAENHGGLYQNLKLLRETDGTAECNLFKAMGLDYLFVKDGNDIDQLIAAFQKVRDITHPMVVHVCTQKGKGLSFAEQDREGWHYHMPFDVETGKMTVSFGNQESYNELTARYLLEKMKKDPTVVAITAGTPTLLGFTPEKRKEAGTQFIDVGIAEEHAVALASGLAKNGCKPVFGVNSTFLQRTYDQMSHDLCLNNNPAVILIFGGTLSGMSDATHLGFFDIPLVSNIPNMVYLAPTSKEEYFAMLEWGIEQTQHPVAIRVPGMGVVNSGKEVQADYSVLNQFEVTKKGSKAAILALGDFFPLGQAAVQLLQEKAGIEATLINPRYITGVDEKVLTNLKESHQVVVTLEDGVLDGGFGEKVARFYGDSAMKVLNFGAKKEFKDRFIVAELLKENHLTAEQITEDVLSALK